MTFLPGPMISPYAENSLRKHTGFTFGLNEKDIVKGGGGGRKSSHLDHLLPKEASESDEQDWSHREHIGFITT